jgi:hypothetical protein
MQLRRLIQRLAWAVAVSSITAGAVAGIATAGAPAATIPAAGVATCVAWTGGSSPQTRAVPSTTTLSGGGGAVAV